MSSPRQDPTDEVDTENVGGLDELIPQPLMPVWTRIERFQQFRETHGETYTKILEGIVAAVLIGGYVYWLYLFFVGG